MGGGLTVQVKNNSRHTLEWVGGDVLQCEHVLRSQTNVRDLQLKSHSELEHAVVLLCIFIKLYAIYCS